MILVLISAFLLSPNIYRIYRWLAKRNGWEISPKTDNLFNKIEKTGKIFSSIVVLLFLLVVLVGFGMCFGYIK